MKEDK